VLVGIRGTVAIQRKGSAHSPGAGRGSPWRRVDAGAFGVRRKEELIASVRRAVAHLAATEFGDEGVARPLAESEPR
jgi:hypothetical protein